MDDAGIGRLPHLLAEQRERVRFRLAGVDDDRQPRRLRRVDMATKTVLLSRPVALVVVIVEPGLATADDARSAEHTSELQSLMRTSYAVCCLQKKKNHTH